MYCHCKENFVAFSETESGFNLFSFSSMLIVRLIRAEDIPVEGQSVSTYVDVHLLPLNTQSLTFEPYDTTINVSFRYRIQSV